jgi:DNA mismatch repair protein MutL
MKHPYFHKAVVEAYQNILPSEAIPSYFIYMEADPASIDINIHPTKTEIKFEDERAIWQILMASVKEALGRFNIVPSLDFENEGLVDIPVLTGGRSLPSQPVIRVNPAYNPFEGEETSVQREGYIEKFERENSEGWQKLYSGLEARQENRPANDTGRKFFQIKNKYIVCQVKSGLMLIDQKRAHERVLFEQFRDCLNNGHSVSQADMFPLTAELDPSDYSVLTEIEKELSTLGFRFDHPGGNKITITGRPALNESPDTLQMIEILLEDYKSTEGSPVANAREKVATAMAGASAIPYGKMLDKDEMEQLFDSLFACQSPNYSPKGKPVITIITLEDIDKKFN